VEPLGSVSPGWVDVDLTAQGCEEARNGGRQLREAGIKPTILHTSVQVRRDPYRRARARRDGPQVDPRPPFVAVERTSLRRASGQEQEGDGRRVRYRPGEDLAPELRRAAAAAPIDSPDSGIDERYADLPREVLPESECLRDVVERMLPYWHEAIAPDLRAGHVVLVAAHGNSLRALVKHLDGMSDADVVELNIPTGMPLVYELDDDLAPTGDVGRARRRWA